MMNEMYEPNAAQNGQPGMVSYPQPMPGMGAGYESLFQILWRGRWLILLTLVLAGAGAYAYLRFATPMYESTARLLVDRPNPQSRSEVPQPVGSTVANYLATQASLITSPEIVNTAMRDPNLLTLSSFSDPNYVRKVVGSLSAEVAKKADIIQITASSPYSSDAAQVVNAVVRAYIRWHDANRQLNAADLLKDLNSQLENRYRELQVKRKEQMLFEQRHPEVLESTPGGMISKTLEMLKQELVTARLVTTERDSYSQGLRRFENEPAKFRQYVYSSRVSAPTSSGDVERASLAQELRGTQVQLDAIAAGVATAQHSQIALLKSRQAEAEKRVAEIDAEFVRDQTSLATSLLEDARAREQRLTEIYEKEFARVRSLSDQDAQYAFLKSECEMMENLCNSLLTQINKLDLDARREGLRIYVLAGAAPAGDPTSPQPIRIIGIALVLGLMAGAGLSFLRDWRDQRVRSPEEITALLGVPILGAIPSVPRRALRRGQKLRFASNSRESEACRTIRTALLCGLHPDQARTILVTSPGPREGKTLLVSNLAMALAQVGLKTLIIDADLRKPLKQRVFTTNGQSRGLVEVLTGAAGVQDTVRPTDIEGLDALEAGRNTSNPSELLSSSAFVALLEHLRENYDRILIDSPPVGAVTDAQILASTCDVTLLVLRADESSRLLTQRAREALFTVGAQVAGVVVNDVPKRDGRYGYTNQYGRYYSNPGSNGHKAVRNALLIDGAVDPDNPIVVASQTGATGLIDDRTVPSTALGSHLEIREYEDRAARRRSEASRPGSRATPMENLLNRIFTPPEGGVLRQQKDPEKGMPPMNP